MTDEERDEILRTAYATLERLEQREQVSTSGVSEIETPAGHFNPIRARQMREPEAEAEVAVRYSEPTTTQPPAPASAPAAEYDAKLAALQAEIDELKSDRSYRRFSDKLDATLRKCNELVDRLERREPDRGSVIDLPSWPRRSGRDVD